MKKLTALLLLLPVFASADPQPWMKTERPNEMYTSVTSRDDCPLTEDEMRELVHGVLIRSRIKPLSGWYANEVALSVTVNCISSTTDNWTYIADIEPVKYSTHESGTILATTFVGSGKGRFGRGDKNSISDAVQDGVEEVITVYLKANFDLGEDDND